MFTKVHIPQDQGNSCPLSDLTLTFTYDMLFFRDNIYYILKTPRI
jgi:hypothetical protein